MEDNLASTILASALNDMDEIIKASENCEWVLQRRKVPSENESFHNSARSPRLTNGSSAPTNGSDLELNNSHAISTEALPGRLHSPVEQSQSYIQDSRQLDNKSHIIPSEFEDFSHRFLNRIKNLHRKPFEVRDCPFGDLLFESASMRRFLTPISFMLFNDSAIDTLVRGRVPGSSR
ncbi:hypothetical protein P879_06200 [Paragonimus westermani]|uniref:Uncharacterized protein n=1 Tax=Paragonimus westermani TaxID=34504 RepID=A0A8T0D4X2_9TREM|nr:hypothetical protein P879_06200 [Paragonimus westermani]